MSSQPIIDLDKENSNEQINLAKSLGYFHIKRLTNYGQIDDEKSFQIFLKQFFKLSNKNSFEFNETTITLNNSSQFLYLQNSFENQWKSIELLSNEYLLITLSNLIYQNQSLRYFTFFYLYIMQGIPAGFSSTALANYLTDIYFSFIKLLN
ncbi:hypothetical protein I4U23_005321 [Adineta vaga]|nr:hypothetical protein I4U23_005321 [Adineta vaga]